MKNLLMIVPVAAVLLLTGCKKNENADQLQTSETETVNAAQPTAQDQLIAEAQSKPLTNLVLSESHFDFGNVKKGEKVDHVYEVTNTGENPLIISAVKPGCGCTAPDYTKEPILPGQKGKITLSFDSSSFEGVQNKQAEVFANVEKAPVLITFAANVQP